MPAIKLSLPSEESVPPSKDSEAPPELNIKLGNFYGCITAVLFGVANYVLANQSAEFGIKSNLFQVVPYLLMSIVFHFSQAFKRRASEGSFFSKKSCTYYVLNEESGEWQLSYRRVAIPFVRSLFNLTVNLVITLTFYFASKSGVNSGIISCNFSSSLVFVAIIFYFKYG